MNIYLWVREVDVVGVKFMFDMFEDILVDVLQIVVFVLYVYYEVY